MATNRNVGGDVTFSFRADACPPSTHNHLVHEYTWGHCAICRQTARCVGIQDILEGSQWCAGYCERKGPWACQEAATMEMVYAWRAWAVASFAAMARDAARVAAQGRRHGSDNYLGVGADAALARGGTVRVRVLA